MALAIAVTTASGFALQLAVGRSNFGEPWWVHVHAVTFMGWLLIYMAQNYLALHGVTMLHRKLGWFAAFYVGWMVIVGVGVNTLATINHRIPFFFAPNEFPIMDWMILLTFAGLTWAGVRMRGATDWHRRLILCGAMIIMTPGTGRLVPLPFVGGWVLLTTWATTVPFTAAAAIYDWRTRGKVHPAYIWGFGAITLAFALMRPIAYSPPAMALTDYLLG